MKQIIVNADDFGASCGTNRAILHAHRYGIVTSASLLVDRPWSDDAAALARATPALSVGLHLDLDGVGTPHLCRAMENQIERFQELMGTVPTHVDVHQQGQRSPLALAHVRRFADRHDLPLRGHSGGRVCPVFRGPHDGVAHPQPLAVGGLEPVLSAGIGDGVTVLVCHPAYPDPELHSSDDEERELEVRALCDPALPALLDAHEVQLIGFRDLVVAVAGAACRC